MEKVKELRERLEKKLEELEKVEGADRSERAIEETKALLALSDEELINKIEENYKEKQDNNKEMSEEELDNVAGGLSKEEYRPIFDAEIGDFVAGQTVKGTIYSIERGLCVYVKISQNLIAMDATVGCEGNIFGYDNLKVGDTVAVYIERIIPEKLKIRVKIVS